jgi:PhnB protein
MKINPYLAFSGNCREAIEFYAKVLDGKIEMMMSHGESPIAGEVPADWQKLIMHARLTFGDGQVLMASDAPPDQSVAKKGITIALVADGIEQGERIFNAFAEGGEVTMPFAETFWAARFGMVTDKFGTPWMVNSEMRPM